MKFIHTTLGTCVFVAFVGIWMQWRRLDDFYVLKEFCELMIDSGIDVGICDGDVTRYVKLTQKDGVNRWIRPNGVDYHQLNDVKVHSKRTFEILKNLGFIDEIYPEKRYYDDVILHGTSYRDFEFRFGYLLRLWRDGIRWKRLILLSGERYFDSEVENKWEFMNSIHHRRDLCFWNPDRLLFTEYDMIESIWNHTEIPKDMIDYNEIHLIDARKGDKLRVNTKDTLNQMFNDVPWLNGSVLAISNQPFVRYQDEVVRNYIRINQKFGITIETVGPRSEYPNYKICLDTISRTLYEISQKS